MNMEMKRKYLPQEGQLIILDGNVPHSPVDALDSDKDRIVLMKMFVSINQ